MIRILASGGLGNQLFIWNLAHNLESKYKCQIEIVFPKSGSDRVCELFHLVDFCDHQIKVTQNNTLNLTFGLLSRIKNKSSVLGRILMAIFSVVETQLPSDTFDFSKNPPRFIRGYFQSPKLVKETLHMYKDELLDATATIAQNSKHWSSNLVARKMLHIRRGDFIHNKDTVGLLTIEYFSNQVERDEEVVIFTDAKSNDPEILNNFPNSLVLGTDSLDTWMSVSLLCHAGHLIASNSTFSWWAGLISLMRGGAVTVPDPWTKTDVYGEHYLQTEDFSTSPATFVEVQS